MRDVYVQKFDINGNKMWGENGIAVTTAYGRQEDPLLVGDGQGGAFVIWIEQKYIHIDLFFYDDPDYL